MTDKAVHKILIAADHGGYDLKEEIKTFTFENLDIEWIDLGTHSKESVDYPDIIHPLAEKMKNEDFDKAVMICGMGIGVSIVANRYKHLRSALCVNQTMARLARQHNDANVLALGGRLVGGELAKDIIQTFFTTEHEGGRHARRVEKLNQGGTHGT